jgi:hypothetical protein
VNGATFNKVALTSRSWSPAAWASADARSRVARASGACLLLGLAQGEHEREEAGIVAGGLRQLERPSVPDDRFGRGQLLPGPLGRPHARGDGGIGAGRVRDRGGAVTGQVDHVPVVVTRHPLDLVSDRPVPGHPRGRVDGAEEGPLLGGMGERDPLPAARQLDEEAGADRGVDRRGDGRVVEAADRPENREVELVTDDGAQAQHVGDLAAEGVGPQGDGLLHRGDDVQLRDVAADRRGAVVAGDHGTGRGQLPRGLEGVQRVAAAHVVQPARERGSGVAEVADRVVDEGVEVLGRETLQLHQLDGSPDGAQVIEQRVEVGARRALVARDRHDEHPHPGGRVDDVAQQIERGPARPVQIVEDEHHRFVAGRRGEPSGHGVGEAQALEVGVAADHPLRARQLLGHLGHDARQLAGERPEEVGQLTRRHVGGVVPDGFRERLEGRTTALGASAVEHEAALALGAPGEVGIERLLPMLSGPRPRPAAPWPCVRSAGVAHGVALDAAADEGRALRERGQLREGHPRRLAGLPPQHLEGAQLIAEPLQLELAELAVRRGAARPGEQLHVLRGEDLVGSRRAAQPRGLDHRRAVHVVGLDPDLADAEPHPQRDRHLGLPVATGDGLLDADRRGDAGARRGEDRHDPVAEALHDGAAVLVDEAGDEVVVLPTDVVGLVVADAAAHRRRVDEIREQHRHGRRAGL